MCFEPDKAFWSTLLATIAAKHTSQLGSQLFWKSRLVNSVRNLLLRLTGWSARLATVTAKQTDQHNLARNCCGKADWSTLFSSQHNSARNCYDKADLSTLHGLQLLRQSRLINIAQFAIVAAKQVDQHYSARNCCGKADWSTLLSSQLLRQSRLTNITRLATVAAKQTDQHCSVRSSCGKAVACNKSYSQLPACYWDVCWPAMRSLCPCVLCVVAQRMIDHNVTAEETTVPLRRRKELTRD